MGNCNCDTRDDTVDTTMVNNPRASLEVTDDAGVLHLDQCSVIPIQGEDHDERAVDPPIPEVPPSMPETPATCEEQPAVLPIQDILNAIQISLARKWMKTQSNRMDFTGASDDLAIDLLEDSSQPTLLLSPQALVTASKTIPLQYSFSVKDASYYSSKKLSDGSIFEGQWSKHTNGHLVRKGKGKLYHIDGSFWEGYWKGGRIHMFGRVIFATGDSYEGQFKAGLRHGSGEFVSYDRKKRYKGEWQSDEKQGLGEEWYADGSVYRGEFQRNLKHGKGAMTWVDGSSYDGDFAEGKIHGKGVFRWKDGRIYDGDWLNGKMHGQGAFTYADGKVYRGAYANDKREGFGVYQWEGKVYEGEWLAGKMHGKGFLTTPDKGRRCYEFRENKHGDEIPST